MDSSQTFTVVSAKAVQAAGLSASQLLLPSATGVGGESALHALVGSGVYRAAVLRSPENDGGLAAPRLFGGSPAGAAPVARDGIDGPFPQAAFEPQSVGAQAISLFAQRLGDRAAQSSLEHRHHLHPVARWV